MATQAPSRAVRPPSAHGVVWDRIAPQAWIDCLHSVVPAEGSSWLTLRWEPGEAWYPIERWSLWQVRPRELTATLYPGHLAELEGPNPRRQGHACFPGWCDCKTKQWRWNTEGGKRTAFIDYWQWRLYQETGLFGTRWWVIQGNKGGNRWSLSQAEERILRLQYGPHAAAVPLPGSQHYEEFDERVIEQIVRHDRVRRGLVAANDLAQISRLRDQLDAMEKQASRDAASAHFDVRESQIADSSEEFAHRWKSMYGHVRDKVTDKEDNKRVANALDRDSVKAEFVDGLAE